MTKRYGHSLDNWHAAREEVRTILIQCARECRTITYGELSALVTSINLPPYSYGMVGMLNEIGDADRAAGRTWLATLVVRKSDGLPGAGYFKSAAQRGMPESDFQAYWEEHFQRVCQEWAE